MEFINLIPNICEGLPFEKGDLVLLNFWGDNEDIEILELISENLSKKGVISFRHQCSKRFFEKIVLNFIRNKNHISKEYFEFYLLQEYCRYSYTLKSSRRNIRRRYLCLGKI